MTTASPRLRANIVLAYLQSAGERTAREIGNECSMRKRDVEHALWLLGNEGKIQDEHRSGGGSTYRATVEPEDWD